MICVDMNDLHPPWSEMEQQRKCEKRSDAMPPKPRPSNPEQTLSHHPSNEHAQTATSNVANRAECSRSVQ